MTGEGPVILNVDDREVSRYTRTRSLKQAGFAVVEAATGAEALRLAEEMQPPAVVLDVRLPDISGIEVCRTIKRASHPTEGFRTLLLDPRDLAPDRPVEIGLHVSKSDRNQLIHFEKDVALAGAFLILGVRGAGRLSFDGRRDKDYG